MAKILTLLSVAIFLFSSSAFAFEDRSISIIADYSAFRLADDSTRSFIEIYYNIPRHQLKFEPAENGYIAYLDFKITIADSSGSLLDTLSWKGASQINQLEQLDDREYLISDLLTELIPLGGYQIDLYISNSNRLGHCAFEMHVPKFPINEISLSSVQLVYDVSPDSIGKFIKSGYKVMPNPSGAFSKNSQNIYLYAEAYNLDISNPSDSLYGLGIYITNFNQDTVLIVPARSLKKPGDTAVIITGFSPASLGPGEYTLILNLTDGQRQAHSFKDFSIFSPLISQNIDSPITAYIANPLNGVITSEADAARFRDDIYYLAAANEIELYDAMELSGKENFRKAFWQRYDTNPGTPENEFQIEYYRRVNYVDQIFGRQVVNLRGLRTDRGRIYMLYGEPTDIERNPSSMETKAWEKWEYNSLEGGVYFVFVDMGAVSDFVLVHSTKRNEIRDDNWESKIRMTTIFQR